MNENYNVGDLVSRQPHPLYQSTKSIIGVVVDILEPQIYDRGERILVQWTSGDKSYEKEYLLTRYNRLYDDN